MKITASILSDRINEACSCTVDKNVKVQDLYRLYKSEHSPIRTKVFSVQMDNIPSFVSVHFARHKIGVEHYVKSLRDDRNGDGTEDRNTPVNHLMIINAQALINMARKRLCGKSHRKTIDVMQAVKESIRDIDYALYRAMLVDCEYRRGCWEFKSCGHFEQFG